MKKFAWVVALFALATVPALAASLEVEVIGARDFMVAFDINSSMTVCGDNQINSTTTAVVWNPLGEASILPGASGTSQCGGVNSFGDAVGWFESAATGASTAVVWYADSGYQAYHEIGKPTPVYLYTQGYQINDAGQVALMAGRAQYVEPGEEPFGTAGDPYRWSAAKGFTPLQGLAANSESMVYDINNRGEIVGSSTDTDGVDHAVVWGKNGKATDIGIPAGERDAVARAINDAGVVIGHDSTFNSDSWKWTAKDGFTKLTDYGYKDNAVAINTHGVIVGTADRSPWSPVPVVWDADNNIYDIQELMWDHGYYATDGVAINDNNEIVIYGINFQNGNRQAVVLKLTFVD